MGRFGYFVKRIPYKKIALQKWAKHQDAEFWRKAKVEKKLAQYRDTDEEEEGQVEETEKEEDEEYLEAIKEAEVDTEELRKETYRCRSAYKLLEIHDKYKLFKPGQTVVDLGCCPGSWTQVAVNATRAKYEKFGSFVLGMDLQKTYPIKGAKIMDKMDFLDPSSQKLIKQALKGRKADVLISDMAPNTTGIRDKDHMQVAELCYSTLKFVPRVCKLGSSLVMKAFDGVECKQIIKDLRFMYEKGIVVHPKATRQPSSEFFYLGLKYRGNKLEPKQQSEPEEEFFEPSDPFEGIEDCNVPSSLSSDELM